MRRLLLGLACLLATVLAAAPAAAAPRLALVVGNAAYPGRPLATAAADAGLVAQALAQAGYSVTAARDLDGKGLRAALRAFADTARDAGPDATILVYLAGYGVQYDGNDYMVPVDAALAHDDDVPLRCADLDDVLRALAAGPAKARLVLLDLARDSPLAPTDEMPLAPGLALTVPPKDTLVAVAAAPGVVAPAAPLPYGPYARALAEVLGTPSLGANAMLERVRLRVATLTDGAQIPWNAGTLSSETGSTSALDRLPTGARSPDIAFAAVLARDSFDGYADFLRAVPDGPLAARVRVLLALRREATMWRAVASSDDPRAAWTYMRRYPRGPHRFDARRRLAALKASLEPPPRFELVVFPDIPPPGDGELALVAHPREALRGLPPIPAPPEALLPPAAAAYGDDLPMPTPAPRGLLPIASPLPPIDGIEPGQITQAGADGGEMVTTTTFAPDGAAALTLADDKGPFLTFATRVDGSGTRTSVETGPKGDVKSRTTTTHVGGITTMVLADGTGTALMRIVGRDDPDGSRTTRVTDGDGSLLAGWRRDAAGIVVASERVGEPPAARPAAAAPVPTAPTSPTVAVPVVPKPPLHAPAHPLAAPAVRAAPVRPVSPPPSTVPERTPAASTAPPSKAPPPPPAPPRIAPIAPAPAPAPPATVAPASAPPAVAVPPPAAVPAPTLVPQAPAPVVPPTAVIPPAVALRAPLPPPRPATVKPRERTPVARPKTPAKPASRPKKPMPHRKGRGAR